MFALIVNHRVSQLSETELSVELPFYWVDITTEHGAVTTGMIYDQADDEFRQPLTAYPINPDTHDEYLHVTADDLPITHTELVPTSVDVWNSTTNVWEPDPAKVAADLLVAKNEKVAEFSSLCGERINSGFNDDALGSVNGYRNNRNDQEKMRVAAESSSGGKIWVGEVFTQHTQTEAQEVRSASIALINLVTSEYSDKYAEIQAATTRAAVEAITWPDPT